MIQGAKLNIFDFISKYNMPIYQFIPDFTYAKKIKSAILLRLRFYKY